MRNRTFQGSRRSLRIRGDTHFDDHVSPLSSSTDIIDARQFRVSSTRPEYHGRNVRAVFELLVSKQTRECIGVTPLGPTDRLGYRLLLTSQFPAWGTGRDPSFRTGETALGVLPHPALLFRRHRLNHHHSIG